MEDDDEFGDLYTDVLRPLAASFQPQEPDVNLKDSSESRPIDLNINSDDEEILYGAGGATNLNNSMSKLNSLGLNSNVDKPPPLGSRGFDLNLDSDDRLAGNGGEGLEFKPKVVDKDEEGVQQLSQKSNFMEDDDIDIVVDEKENKNDDVVEKGSDVMAKKEIIAESRSNFVDETVVGEIDAEQMIPGLSGRLGNDNRSSNLEDEWESEDSEDDLQIVLNDNNHGPMGMDRMMGLNGEDDDEDEQELVIVADNGDVGNQHSMMETQDWAGDEGGPGVDGERKELGDAAKAGGQPAALTAAQPKVAYGGHAYHNSFHSQFKYVRPGAAPIPGAAPVPSAGMPGQIRPPVTMTPAAGRGRGDWRPAGVRGAVPIHKGLQPGYGMPCWEHNTAGRGYGSGLDFTLPSHKTIFEVDIDSFEEKPWQLSGIDVSDFFNFGLNEDSWKDYCKQLEHLRLETTMQSKIRVYESGRAEQDYDPDLPPELAAAVGIQDIPSDNANVGRPDAATIDLARSSVPGRPPLPVGRPIPVETGSGDRLPSIDTRRPRMHDIDAIIEIFCHSSTDDDDTAEQQDNGSRREDLGGGDESDDLQQDVAEHINNLSPAYNDRQSEVVVRRAQSKKTVSNEDNLRKDALHSLPQAPEEYHSGSEIGVSDEERSTKGEGRAGSVVMTGSDDKSEKHITGDWNEESNGPENATQEPRRASSCAGESGNDEALVDRDDMNDKFAMDDGSLDMDREGINVDGTTSLTTEDDNLMNSAKKKLISHAEQVSQESESREDSEAARSSGNSSRRSGRSRDDRRFTDSIEDEVVQERHPPRVADTRRPLEDVKIARRKGNSERDETGRHHKVSKGREDSYSHRGADLSSSLRRNMRSGSADWRKESDMSEGSWNWREEDYHGRRYRVEEPRKRQHGGETGSRNRDKVRENERSEKDEYHQPRNQMDNGSHRVWNHDQYNGSRKSDRDEILKGRNERLDDLRSKRRKEEAHLSVEYGLKEDISSNHIESGLRKRERNGGPDLRRREDRARLKDGNVHYVEQMEETSFQRERSDRRRQSDDWHRLKQEENLSRREREDTQSLMRVSRAGEDKTWISHPRGKDNYRGSGRQYHQKDVGRNDHQVRRRDSVENEDFSLQRVSDEIYARGNQLSNDEKSARYERHRTGDECVAFASDASGLHEHKQKETTRKSKESKRGHHTSLSRSRRNQDGHSVQISETGNSKGRMEHQSGEDDVHVNHHSSRKHHKEEEGSSDGEQAASLRKGRSKLERWTSHKERVLTSSIPSSSSLKTKDVLDTPNNRGEEPSNKIDEKSQPSMDSKEAAAEVNNNNNNNVDPKVKEGKNLDTVEKLKKRSERFKLPLPSEKDPVAIKKMESEPLPSAHAETRADSEIKSERPPRKRRWTGS